MRKVKFISLILVAVVLASATSIFASDNPKENNNNLTTSVSGVILDETTGESLVGVAVKIDGTDLEVYTDFEGGFLFDNITPGDYTVSVAMISYKKESSKLTIKLGQDNTIKIKLKSVENR